MKNTDDHELLTMEFEPLTILNTIKNKNILMGSKRVCDNCGHTKETYGAKTCSSGHFICHSCASGHVHCPLCKHTLR